MRDGPRDFYIFDPYLLGMQFQHPELLYALALLLIPIFIHLFQLRRFQKIDFTNVAFLKKVTIETRKSSQLKKWLTLLARLLALACIVLAFAQPFTAPDTALNTNKETVLYLDNSFSMQAKGAQGPLLQRALQDLFSQAGSEDRISWFTNNSERRNVSATDFNSEVLSVQYTHKSYTPEQVLLKANQLFSNDASASKRLIYISDFQQGVEGFPEIPENLQVDAIQLAPVSPSNISIDTAYVSSKSTQQLQLQVDIVGYGDIPQNVPVSLYDGETLIAKTAATFITEGTRQGGEQRSSVIFDLEDPAGFKGRIEVLDASLNFDNSLFFSINSPNKIKVLAVNEESSDYLQRLFDQPEFEFQQQSQAQLNYNDIPSQHFIILNELESIPISLTTALISFRDGGGSLLIIPSEGASLESYNSLLNGLGLGSMASQVSSEKKITQINFDHPLFENVFERRVVNFQYPSVNSYYRLNSTAGAALRYEDGTPFVIQQGGSYLLTAAINTSNSNITSSPLIVPTLYNMAQLSLPLPRLYYEIGIQNTFAVPVSLLQDDILRLQDSTQNLIPRQQTKANSVLISTIDEPAKSGVYQISNKEEFIENVSFNYGRSESNLRYVSADDWSGATVYNNLNDAFENLRNENTINSLWKWFVIFALVFLLIEMLILKFYR